MSALQLSKLKELSSQHLIELKNSLKKTYPNDVLNSIFYDGVMYHEYGENSTNILSPFLDQTYLDKIYEHIILKNIWSKEEIEKMKEIIQYIDFVDNILKPLKQLNINYDIAIAGGAIRDFYTHQYKSIKDLDIIINMYSSSLFISKEDVKSGLEKYKFAKEYEILKPILNKLSLPEFEEDLKSDATIFEQFIFHIIRHTLENSNEIKIDKYFYPKGNRLVKNVSKEEEEEKPKIKDSTTTYINELLRGIIKLKPKENSLPVDILISNASINEYVEAFDFGICQTSLSNSTIKKFIKDIDNIQEEEIYNVINNIDCHQNFINDIIYKKLTFLLAYSSLETIEKIFTNHLVRLMNKYPDNKVGVLNRNLGKITQENEQISYTLSIDELIDNLFDNHTNKIYLFLRDEINFINLSKEMDKFIPINNKIIKRKKI